MAWPHSIHDPTARGEADGGRNHPGRGGLDRRRADDIEAGGVLLGLGRLNRVGDGSQPLH